MRRIVIGLACAITIGLVACQVQGQCETPGGTVEYCAAANDPSCQGKIVDATHWESAPEGAPLLVYGPEQTYHMRFLDPKTGQVLAGVIGSPPLIQISASQQNGEWIDGANQLAVMRTDGDGAGMTIRNDTCGSYFFRVVVNVIPYASTDAGTD